MDDHRAGSPAILVHGGAGRLAEASAVDSTISAAREGMRLLLAGAPPVAAVERAINILEDDVQFDAGTGASLGLDGHVELDAGLMRGSDHRIGAVGGVQRVRYPISLARRVLEDTTYVLLVGEGAERYGRLMGMPAHDPRTPDRIAQWETLKGLLLSGDPAQIEKIPAMYRNPAMVRWAQEGRLAEYLSQAGDTVGAVAVDAAGRLAAGSSTGGSPLKLPGRAGSASIPGAGFYAEDGAGAAAATGNGEALVQEFVCLRTVAHMREGASAPQAVERMLGEINTHPRGPWRVGLIAVDAAGRLGAGVNVADGLPSAGCTGLDAQIHGLPRTILEAIPPLPGAIKRL